MTSSATRTGAVVRKPSGKEPAGCRGERCRGLYGDFDNAVEVTAADDAADGMITAPGGGGDEAGVARRQGSEADLGLAGRGLGRALPWLALGQRDRSG
jgi:hypothetical protein